MEKRRWKVEVLKQTESSAFVVVEANEAWAAQEIAVEMAQRGEVPFPEPQSVEYKPGTIPPQECGDGETAVPQGEKGRQ